MANNQHDDDFDKLSNLEFPLNKQKIISDVQTLGLSSEFMSKVKRIPNREYNSKDELVKELSKIR